MNKPSPRNENSSPYPQVGIQQNVDNSTVGGGMQAIMGDGNIQVQGESNVVTFNKTEILQISVEEIKTRQFIQTSPYKGLKKFEPEDKDLFFGRDQFLTGLVNELEQTNLVLLLGASGSGKSSLVRAGLIPWLSQKWGSRLINLTFTPDSDPFESFYASLLSKYKQAEAQIAREAKVDTLSHVVARLKQSDDYWLILIDQFEELFTTSKEDKRDQFIASLVQLSKMKQPAVKIIATMRADFLNRLSPYPQLVKATDKHRPFIAQMQYDELRLAIEQPAAQHGVVFEQGLVEEIIKNVQGQAGYLPLLQYTLNLVWETEVKNNGISDRTLNIKTYRQLGGVRGALQQRVDEIYNALTKAEQLSVQRIFLKLVEIGEDEELGTEWKPVRRRAMRFEFNDPLEEKVLTQLIDQQLLVSNSPVQTLRNERSRSVSAGLSRAKGDTRSVKPEAYRQSQSETSTIDIAHEALLTSWTRLNDWIRENRQAIALRNRLNEDVAQWQMSKASGELWRGSKLEQVLELRRNDTFNQVLGGFSEAANQFINASVGRRDQQRRRIIIGLSGFSTVALALAAFTTFQYWRAEKGQITALQQTSEARFAVNRNSFDALLVSLDATNRLRSLVWGKNDPQTQTQMRTTLGEAVYWTRERNRLEEHTDIVQSVSFSPNGQMLATASYDNTVKLWRRDGSLITTLKGHTQPVMSVSFSPVRVASPQGFGQTIASGSQDGTVKLWDSKGKIIRSFNTHSKEVRSVRFSRDGKTIATGNADNTAKLWRIDDGQLLHTLKGHSGWVRQVIFRPDDKQIATVSNDKTIKLWSRDGKLQKTLTGHTDEVKSADFSPDGQVLVTASSDKTVKLWNKDGKPFQTLKHPEEVWSVQFTRDGQTIASSSFDGSVRLWSRDGKELSYTLLDTWVAHQGLIPTIDFSPDGQMIATGGNDNITKLWQVNRNWLTVLFGHKDIVYSARFSPDGKQVASTSGDQTVKLWSPEGKLLSTLIGHKGGVYDVSFSPDGQIIASAGDDNTVRLWSLDGKTLPTLQGHKDSVNLVSFSPDGQIVASASDDGTAKLWRLNGTEIRTLKGHSSNVYGVSFSPDGKIIATASNDQTVKLWKLDGTEIKTLEEHKGLVRHLNFSPDGKIIATASADKTVKLWNLEGKAIATLSGHNAEVNRVSFSPNGQTIATASSDRIIKLWQRDGTLIMTLIGHQSDVMSVSFSPNGKFLLSAGGDRLVLLWDVSDLSLKGLQANGCKQVYDYLKSNLNASYNFCD